MKKRVLIVDDEKNIRLTISKSLTSDTLETEAVINAEEALERLALYHYDLVLLDLRLPGMDGREMLRQLRALKINVPVVVISAHGTIDTAVKLLQAGVLDFIEKPFSPDEIRSVVMRYL